MLLERDVELHVLAGAVRDATVGRGRVLLLSGEAGIGKTALVRAFVDRVEGDVRILVGSCDDLTTPRPLGPLRDVARGRGGPLASALDGPVDPEAVYVALYEELSNPLRATVLIIEDVHWADDATLDALRFVVRRLEELRAVLVLTYRDDVGAPEGALQGLIAAVARGPHDRLALRPLSRESIRTLAGDVEVDVQALHRSTAGNPFFVTEVLANREATIPASVVEAVLARIGGLAPASRGVLEQLAVVPSTVEHWLVDALFNSPEVLADIEKRGLITARQEGVAFRHELARRAVEEAVPASRRMELNRRVVTALLERNGLEHARIVHHAGEGHDDDTLVRFAPLAAREAAAAGAHRQAASHLYQLLPHLDRFPPEERAALLEDYARECYFTGSGVASAEAQRRAIGLRRELGHTVAVGDGLRHLSRTYWMLGQRAEAEQAVDAAIEELEGLSTGRHELAMAYSSRSQLAMLALQNDDAITWGEKAIALAEEIGDDETLTHALNNVGLTRWAQGDNSGRELVERSLELALRGRLDEDICRAYTNLIWASIETHDFDDAARLLTDAIPIAERAEQVGLLIYDIGLRARLRLMTGDWEGAEDDAHRGMDQPIQGAAPRWPALIVKATLEGRRGDSQSTQTLESAHQIAEHALELQRIGPAAEARAELAWLTGQAPSAVPAVRRALNLAIEVSYRPLQARLAYWLWKITGEVTDVTGDEPELLQMNGEWQQAAQRWAALGCPYHQALALSESGQADPTLTALTILDGLGAKATATIVRRDLHRLGVSTVPRAPRRSTRTNPAGLTDRQLQILRLLADGHMNTDIADSLVLSVRTVENHVSAVLAKLQVNNRQEAVTVAHEAGIV